MKGMSRMYEWDRLDKRIDDLEKRVDEIREDLQIERSRNDRIWWKVGALAAIVAVVASEVFGNGLIGNAIDILLGAW